KKQVKKDAVDEQREDAANDLKAQPHKQRQQARHHRFEQPQQRSSGPDRLDAMDKILANLPKRKIMDEIAEQRARAKGFGKKVTAEDIVDAQKEVTDRGQPAPSDATMRMVLEKQRDAQLKAAVKAERQKAFAQASAQSQGRRYI